MILLLLGLIQPMLLYVQAEQTISNAPERLKTKRFDSRIPLLYSTLAGYSDSLGASEKFTEHLYRRAIDTSRESSYLKGRAHYLLGEEKLSDAESDFRQMLTMDNGFGDDAASAWIGLSEIRQKQGKEKEAVAFALKALQENPYHQETHG